MIRDNKRPVNLRLITFKFPATAILSILHRITGVFLFLLLPFSVYLLSILLTVSPMPTVLALLNVLWVKFLAWSLLLCIILHVLAGVRHMIMDMGYGEGFPVARATALVVLIAFAFLVIITGDWLWM
jgi:succinate dehydrogenase / fumarate reductase, cytochrome b subunit